MADANIVAARGPRILLRRRLLIAAPAIVVAAHLMPISRQAGRRTLIIRTVAVSPLDGKTYQWDTFVPDTPTDRRRFIRAEADLRDSVSRTAETENSQPEGRLSCSMQAMRLRTPCFRDDK